MKLRPGVTVGLGVSLDTQNLNEAAHKVLTVPSKRPKTKDLRESGRHKF